MQDESQKKEYESSLKKIIQEQVELSIKTNVNGKIDRLTVTVNDYIKLDTEWKKTAQPYVNLANESSGFIKITGYFIVGITAIGVAMITIFKLLTTVKHL